MVVKARNVTAMSVLLLSFLGVSMGAQCPIWKEIAPCTCWIDGSQHTTIYCEKVNSFDEVVNRINGKFDPIDKVTLWIQKSKLDDLQYRRFNELNITIANLKLNHNSLVTLVPSTFDGLQNNVVYFSVADNLLGKVPKHIWWQMPRVKTLDLGRTEITELTESSFEDLPEVESIVLAGNKLTRMDTNSIPPQVQRLHIGRNALRDLNGTVTKLTDLIWLFVNGNYLTSLENQLPYTAPKLKMIHASNNLLPRLPQQLRNIPTLESFFVQHNHITSLDGALARSRDLKRVVLEHNRIEALAPDDFEEAQQLENLILGHNQIKYLNNSLVSLKSLKFLNMTHNLITHFSFQEIMGLRKLHNLDLSHNRIRTITGPAANLVDWNIQLTELHLEHNEIESLNGALSGLPLLLRLYLNHNKLSKISPDDLIGLDQLRLLDISHNRLTTLEEMSTTFLPNLEELKASHNWLTILDKDFHGLPVLCHADLSNNHIIALGRDLVSKTRCKIARGVHDGAWDDLKIYLQENPIICDAAFPEISSAMEINHTRIYGVAHCPPINEQPVTREPSRFLGYIPETTPPLPAALANQAFTEPQRNQAETEPINNPHIDSNNNLNVYPIKQTDLTQNDQYIVPINAKNTPTGLDINQSITSSFENNEPSLQVEIGIEDSAIIKRNRVAPLATDQLVKQEEQLSQLASEVQVLKTKIEQLATELQNHSQSQVSGNTNDQGIKILDDPPIKEDPGKP